MSTHTYEELELEIEDENLADDPRYEGVFAVRISVEVEPPLRGSYSYNAASDIDYHGHDAYVEDVTLDEVFDLSLPTPEGCEGAGDYREPTKLEQEFFTAWLQASDSHWEKVDELGRSAFYDAAEAAAEDAAEARYESRRYRRRGW